MKNLKQGIFSFLTVSMAAMLLAAPAVAQDEDVAESVVIGAPQGTVTEIGAMTIPNVVLDFDSMPAGATSVGAIQAAFPGSSLAGLTWTTRAGTGVYNFQTGGGRALAASDDGSGSLVLVDGPAGVFGNADILEVTLSSPTTEMGFEIGDWAGTMDAEAFDGVTMVGSVTTSTAGDDRTHFIQSTTPFDRVLLVSRASFGVANWVVPSLHLPTGGEEGTTRFFVSKVFDDGNTAEVEVTLSCNTGLPLQQTTTISAGDPVNFVVVDFVDGTLDCEVTEEVPAGYTASYDDGTTVSADSCVYEDIAGATSPANACTITNSLNQVAVDVTKVWIDENPQFNAQNVANAEWDCSNVAFGADSGLLQFFGNPGEDSFAVYPDWDSGTTCSVTEVELLESGIEVDDSDCQGIVVFPGVGGSCTIFNTRLYEGIPTLSQYGLGILALLMLGVGFVAVRRFV
ncbi:MAG: IPTL-CTERM sorting domain-containing protein [Xanthomonadales bacterium]|nr:IPTL-CTERM sorting domain-containing protein [Xanthomonadales bacterium]